MAEELPVHLRREKLALQFRINIVANPNNPVNETMFNPQYVDFVSRKREFFQLIVFILDFNPDSIAGSMGWSFENHKA